MPSVRDKLVKTLERHNIQTVTENGRTYFRVATDDDAEFIVYVEQDEHAADQWVLRAFPLFSIKNETWEDSDFLREILQWCSVLLLSPMVHPLQGGYAIGFQRVLNNTAIWEQVEDFVMDVAIIRAKLMQIADIEWEFVV